MQTSFNVSVCLSLSFSFTIAILTENRHSVQYTFGLINQNDWWTTTTSNYVHKLLKEPIYKQAKSWVNNHCWNNWGSVLLLFFFRSIIIKKACRVLSLWFLWLKIFFLFFVVASIFIVTKQFTGLQRSVRRRQWMNTFFQHKTNS